jgi:hypothetical protein
MGPCPEIWLKGFMERRLVGTVPRAQPRVEEIGVSGWAFLGKLEKINT